MENRFPIDPPGIISGGIDDGNTVIRTLSEGDRTGPGGGRIIGGGGYVTLAIMV